MESNSFPTERDELLDLFVACTNVSEPDHPYKNNPYPITRDELQSTWCRSDGPYWAKCGPGRGRYVVRFDPCTKELLQMETERVLAIMTHELAHIPEGRHTDGGNHNKAFWREMAFVAWMIRENLEELEAVTGQGIDEWTYLDKVVHDPNEFTVDGRVETVKERRTEMAELLGVDGEMEIRG